MIKTQAAVVFDRHEIYSMALKSTIWNTISDFRVGNH